MKEILELLANFGAVQAFNGIQAASKSVDSSLRPQNQA
jgi:hypothetical protein